MKSEAATPQLGATRPPLNHRSDQTIDWRKNLFISFPSSKKLGLADISRFRMIKDI